jgi:CHAD domain-containing protein
MAKSRMPPAAGKAAAAAAVAIAGAAAAGGKLAHDRRARGAPAQPDRTFRLKADEYVPDGVRRIARGRLADAHDRLDGASGRDLGPAVHGARKDLKRLRACVRLSRDALGEETYERETTTFRMAGRRLSGARDAQVLAQTLDGLAERFAGELPPGVTAALRARLHDEHERAQAALKDEDDAIGLTLGELDDARTRTASWALHQDGFAALKPGLRRIYRRGRKRIRAAARDPTTENLHEARKRVKDLWHATQILRPAAPKRMKKLAREVHSVADLLGDDHDLAVLRDYAQTHPQCFEDEDARRALLAVLDRRRAVLQRRALKLGRRLYKPSPKRFVASIENGWNRRAAARPQSVAG